MEGNIVGLDEGVSLGGLDGSCVTVGCIEGKVVGFREGSSEGTSPAQ